MPRKHLVASQTNKKQQLQAKTWLKLAREIKAATKVGGPNPDANPRLKAAIDKALENNLSRDSIDRNINGSNKDSSVMTTLEYECYGPSGLQIIINALTDNQNRTSGSVHGYLSKIHAEISKPNSVKPFFDQLGTITLKKDNLTMDQLLEYIIDYKIVDVVEFEDGFEILTIPSDFYKIKDVIKNANFAIIDSDIKYISKNKINLTDEWLKKIEHFICLCDEDEDIQWVVTNLE